MTPSPENLVPEIWYQKYGTRNLVPDIWYQIYRNLVLDIWYQIFGTRILVAVYCICGHVYVFVPNYFPNRLHLTIFLTAFKDYVL